MANFDDISILEYLDAQGIPYVQKGADSYCLRDHDSLMITRSSNMFNWFSRGKGGHGVYKFVQTLMEEDGVNMSSKDLVEHLVNIFGETRCQYTPTGGGYKKERPAPYVPTKNYKAEEAKPKGPFVLPPAWKNTDRIRKYLCEERGISLNVFNTFVASKLLYESNEYKDHYLKDGQVVKYDHPFWTHNAIFLRIDPAQPNWPVTAATSKGLVKSAATGKRFSGDVPNSAKQGAICLFWGKNVKVPDHIIIFEAEIDMMSYLSLQEANGVDFNNFLCASIGGVNEHQKIPKGIQALLEQFPTIQRILIGFDNDWNKPLEIDERTGKPKVNVGQAAACSLHHEVLETGRKATILHVRDGRDGAKCKDWNECLVQYRKGNYDLIPPKKNVGQVPPTPTYPIPTPPDDQPGGYGGGL